jgi:hypothetical protein
VKLVKHQLIAAEVGKIRPKQESRPSDLLSLRLPKTHLPINFHAVKFHSDTASLVTESELIGIDSYA